MGNKKIYQSIILYKDMAPQILELEKVEAGEILQAIMRYSCYGEDTDMSQYDRFVRSLWKTIKLKLDAGEVHDKEISETNRKNVMKRWEKKSNDTTEYDRIQSSEVGTTEYDRTTITDTVTGTISSTTTNSSTVTKQEQADADTVFADWKSASAAADNAEPPSGDLFSVKQLISTSKRNKVELTSEGVAVFHEEMQDSGWILYGEPVKKKFITRALRAWAKYHPEYAPEEKVEEELFPKELSQKSDVQPEEAFIRKKSTPEELEAWALEKYGKLEED